MKILIFLLCLLLGGCISTLTPEAQLAIAQREVSFRAIGMMGLEPMSGTVFCILCAITYDRNLGQGPVPGSH